MCVQLQGCKSFLFRKCINADGSGIIYGLGEPEITIYQQTSNLAYKRFQCSYLSYCLSQHLEKECKKLIKKLLGGFIFRIVKNEGVLPESSSGWVWINYWDFAFRFNLNTKLPLKFILVNKLACSFHALAYMHKIPKLVRIREAWWQSWGHGLVQTSALIPAGGNERERRREPWEDAARKGRKAAVPRKFCYLYQIMSWEYICS